VLWIQFSYGFEDSVNTVWGYGSWSWGYGFEDTIHGLRDMIYDFRDTILMIDMVYDILEILFWGYGL